MNLAGVAPAQVTPEIIGELDRFIARAMGAFGVPGVAVAIVQDGEVVHRAGYGVTRAGVNEPVTADTRMMIGSAGKSLTTLLMGALVDDGLLRWDTPVVEFLPEFSVADPALTSAITARDLVCACSGVPRRDPEILFNAEELTAEDVVASLSEFEFYTAFGEAFQYSNQLVATGGFLAAAADGAVWGELQEGFETSLRTRVFDPIGMSRTTSSFAEVESGGNYAHPHILTIENRFEAAPLEMEQVVESVVPAGGLWSTANDLARYLLLELARGTSIGGAQVVSPKNVQVRWEPQVPSTSEQSYGLGWFVDQYKGLRLIHHSGNTFGFTSELAFPPEAGVGIGVLSNGRDATFLTQAVRTRLFELLFNQAEEAQAQAEFRWQEAVQRNEHIRRSLAPAPGTLLAEFEGVYVNPTLGKVTVRSQPGGLILEVGLFDVPMVPLREKTKTFIGVSRPAPGYVSVQFAEGHAGPEMRLSAGGSMYQFAPPPN